jgi:tetratricopeptide (TPR) repeat protein
MIGRRAVQALRSAPSPMASAAVGLGFGVLAIVIQSFVDFGQHLPANAMLTAVACAMLGTLAEASHRTHTARTGATDSADRSAAGEAATRKRAMLRAAGLSVAMAVFAITAFDAARATSAESSWSEVRPVEAALADRRWQGDDQVYRQLLIPAQEAADRRPGNLQYRYWLNFYRWQLISRVRDSKTGQLLFDAQRLQWADQISQELLASTWRCPTYGPPYLLAGEIQRNILNRPEGAELIRAGYRLSQNDPVANYEAAMLDARQGQWEPAMLKFQHAAAISAPFLLDGVDALAGEELSRPDLALRLANHDVAASRRVVEILKASNDPRVTEAEHRVAELIRAHAQPPNAPADALIDAARLAVSEKEYPSGIELYKRALSDGSARPQWRLELARALAANGQAQEALDEARLAQRLGDGEADAFIVDLRLRPTTAGEKAQVTTPK